MDLRKPADSNNYKWSDSVGAAKTLKFNITQATNEWTTTPSITDVTYGATINPQYAAKFGTVSVKYVGAGGTSYAESATAPTTAGSYTAKFSVDGTDNYTELSTNVGFTIAKAGSQTEVKDNQTVTYGETLTLTAKVSKSATNSLSLFSVDADKVEFYVGDTSLGMAEVTYDDDTAKDSGTATLTINTVNKQLAIGDNNYSGLLRRGNQRGNVYGTVTIDKDGDGIADVTITVPDDTESVTVDENGSVIVPENSAVQVGENEEITLTGGGTVDKDGNVSGDEEITAHRIVLDEDGNATVVSPTDGTYTVIFAAYDKNGVLTSIKLVIQEFAVGFTPVSSPEDFKPNENGTVKYIITQI